mmetsp:Transcript_20387/g.56504  ORF Transcript_20387/g.56504 Transcript_20387/m.56504 type:complete len:351 (-) Transcript_20387:1150-2202(-)
MRAARGATSVEAATAKRQELPQQICVCSNSRPRYVFSRSARQPLPCKIRPTSLRQRHSAAAAALKLHRHTTQDWSTDFEHRNPSGDASAEPQSRRPSNHKLLEPYKGTPWDPCLTHSVYRRQTIHEPTVQEWNQQWSEFQGTPPAEDIALLEMDQSTLAVAAAQSIGSPSSKPQRRILRDQAALSPETWRRLRAQRRQRKREERYSLVAVSNGVEPEVIRLAAEKRRKQRRHGDVPFLSGSSKRLSREEERELVEVYQAWAEAANAGKEWAEKTGQPASPEVLAEVLAYPGGAAALRLLQRDALFALQELQRSFLSLIEKYAYSLSPSGVPMEDLLVVLSPQPAVHSSSL